MASKPTLPLRLLVNTNVSSGDELLDKTAFKRLCIIGKSENGRIGQSGIYKSAGDVARDYGVEASEYLIAVNHFNQFDDGEVLIVTADYASITRPPVIVPVDPPIEPEPDDGDFVVEYVTVNYEPIDVEPLEPEPPIFVEPPIEPEPPKPIACISNKVDFNTFRVDASTARYADSISVWAAIEIDGVDYVVGTNAAPMDDFTDDINANGAGFNANKLIDILFENLIKQRPELEYYINSHTNYPVTSFDFGKRFSGVDASNKDDLIEVINSIGGQADNFRPEPITIKIKSLPVDVLNAKITRGSKPANLIDLFNKGQDFELTSCLTYDYVAPKMGGMCQAKPAEFNTVNDTYLDFVYDLSICAKITIGDFSDVVVLPARSSVDIKADVYNNGTVNTANKLLILLIKKFMKDNPDYDGYIKSRTNYLLASYDLSRALGGIDGNNVDAFTSAMKSSGGIAKDFKSEKSIIAVRALSGGGASEVSNENPESLAVDLTDLFNLSAGFDLESCLKFNYEKPTHGNVTGGGDDPDIDFEWTPIVVPNPPAVTTNEPFRFTTVNGNATYAYQGANSISAVFSLTVLYNPSSNGNFVIKENGTVIFDNTLSTSLSNPKPFYGDYTEHHVIRSYIKDIQEGDIAHTLYFGDRFYETYRDGEPILVEGEPSGEYEQIVHPLLVGRAFSNNYTIESTAGGPFKVRLVISSEVDPTGHPIQMNVTSFGNRCSNVEFWTEYHYLSVPTYLPPTMTNLDKMFMLAGGFNGNISGWDMKYVRSMRNFFYQNPFFNQDLSYWCLSQFDPNNVATNYPYTPFNSEFISLPSLLPDYYPKFGRCPVDDEDPLP